MPRDPRSLIKKADVQPTVIKTVCCRSCFSLYPSNENVPHLCNYQQFCDSEPCHEELFVKKTLHSLTKDRGQLTLEQNQPLPQPPSTSKIPRCLYISQSISSWISWLLSLQDTEKAIDDWRDHVNSQSDTLVDCQSGTAFKEHQPKTDQDSDLTLSLSLFVDWFNPRGNKIGGTVESTGLFLLSCLNLPPNARNHLSRLGLLGVTPGPHSPDPQTINHLLKPVVDELIQLEPGITLRTHQYPNGRRVRIRLLCLQGDILATKKVAGFASHSANLPCSWCNVQHKDLAKMERGDSRLKDQIRTAAEESKNARSQTARDLILRRTGVRWSELNRLSYWDPSKHVVLGVMHNWLEGILQAHFRYRWGFQSLPSYKLQKRPRQLPNSSTRSVKRRRLGSLDADERMDDVSSEDESHVDGDETDILLHSGRDGRFFSQEDIRKFQECLQDVVLPSGLAKLPANLGEERHGRLKAAQWYTLFAYVVPLVILDLYVDTVSNIDVNSNRSKFLCNTGYLVQCTHIICSRSLRDNDAKRFQINYEKYSCRIGELFGTVKVQPNHHYALHVPEQIRAWGPPIALAEFSGERAIGFLQSIRTNNLIGKQCTRQVSSRYGLKVNIGALNRWVEPDNDEPGVTNPTCNGEERV